MKLTSLLSFIILMSCTTLAQEKEERTIPEFNAVEVSSGVDLYIVIGNHGPAIVEASKSEIHKVQTEVKGGVLKVYTKNNYKWSTQPIKVTVTCRTLNRINSSGGSDVYTQSTVVADHLELNSSGGSDMYIETTAKKVSIASSGGSDIKIKGSCDDLVAKVSGGSDLHANDLKATNVNVNSSGGADASVFATASVTANASGGSDIYIYGNPASKDVTSSGAGDINWR